MSYPQFKIEVYKKISSEPPEWSLDPIDITTFIDLSESEKINDGAKIIRDTFEFSYFNNDLNGDGYGDLVLDIKEDDLVLISGQRDGGGYDLIMSGKVEFFVQEITHSYRKIQIRGMNRTQSLLRSVFSLSLKNDRVNMMIVSILKEANEFNGRAGMANKIFFVYYNPHTSAYEDQDGNPALEEHLTIQRTRSDGQQFDVVGNFDSWFDPAYLQIEKLSGATTTKDGNYIFYIDNQNRFFWESKSNIITGMIHEIQVLSATIEKNNDAVVNFMIVHAGQGPYNYGIMTFVTNDESIAEHGLKGRFMDMTHISQNVMKLEQEANPGDFDDESFPFPIDGVLHGAGYTMNFANGTNVVREAFSVGGTWYSPTGNDANPGTRESPKKTIVVTTRAEYNEAVEKEVKGRAKFESQPIVDKLGATVWSARIKLKGTTDYNKGNLLLLNFPSQRWTGINQQLLRVHEIRHSFTKQGWHTDLILKEDEETI